MAALTRSRGPLATLGCGGLPGRCPAHCWAGWCCWPRCRPSRPAGGPAGRTPAGVRDAARRGRRGRTPAERPTARRRSRSPRPGPGRCFPPAVLLLAAGAAPGAAGVLRDRTSVRVALAAVPSLVLRELPARGWRDPTGRPAGRAPPGAAGRRRSGTAARPPATLAGARRGDVQPHRPRCPRVPAGRRPGHAGRCRLAAWTSGRRCRGWSARRPAARSGGGGRSGRPGRPCWTPSPRSASVPARGRRAAAGGPARHRGRRPGRPGRTCWPRRCTGPAPSSPPTIWSPGARVPVRGGHRRRPGAGVRAGHPAAGRARPSRYQLAGAVVRVQTSIGLAELSRRPAPADVLRQADLARRRAVQLGRDRVEWYDAYLEEQLVRRLDLERELPGAVARGELDLVYQPVVDLADGQPVGRRRRCCAGAARCWARCCRPSCCRSPRTWTWSASWSGGCWTGPAGSLSDWSVGRPGAVDGGQRHDPGADHRPTSSQRVAAVLAAYGVPPERLVVEVSEPRVAE